MRKKYVLRKETFEKKYELDFIRPYEALYSAIFGTRNEDFYHSDYNRIKDIDNAILKKLTPFEIKVILYRFGFTGEWYSLQQVGETFNLSRERIRQVENKALRKMRHPSFSRNIRPKYIINKEEEISGTEESPIKEIIISGLKNHIFTLKEDKIIESILRRNDITICRGSNRNGSLHYIDDYELSVRTYNCLKRAGIDTLEAVASKNYEEMCKVRNLGRKSLEEILDVIRDNNIAFSTDWSEYMHTTKKTSHNATNKYITVDVSFKDAKSSYKFVNMSQDELAKCVYDIIINEFDYSHLIYNYKISTGLLYLLLIKGYLFVEKIIEDASLIRNELFTGGYSDYIGEFNVFEEKMNELFVNERNPIVSFYILDNTIARNVIKKKASTCSELVECCNVTDEEESNNAKEILKKMCMFHRIAINIKDIEKNNNYQEYLDVEITDFDDGDIDIQIETQNSEED